MKDNPPDYSKTLGVTQELRKDIIEFFVGETYGQCDAHGSGNNGAI